MENNYRRKTMEQSFSKYIARNTKWNLFNLHWLNISLCFFVAVISILTFKMGLAKAAFEVSLFRNGNFAAPTQPGKLTARLKGFIVDKNAKGQEAIFILSHDGRTLATKSERERKVSLWDIATNKVKIEFRTSPPLVYRLAFSPDDLWFTASTPKGEVTVWDVRSGTIKTRFSTELKGDWVNVAIDWENWVVVTSNTYKPLIKLWDLRTGQIIRTLEHPPRQNPFSIFDSGREQETKDGATDLSFISHGQKLLSVSSLFSRIYVWDVKTGELEKTLVGGRPLLIREQRSHGNTIYDLALDPTGRYLATPSRDGTAALWDLRTMKWITSIEDFNGPVVCAAFSPDGRTLAATSGDQNRKVKLWDVQNNRLIATLTGFKKNVHLYNENFSPDGRIIAIPSAGSRMPGLKLYDTGTGQALASIDEALQPVAFNPDGRTMMTGGPKGEVLLWDLVRN